jgi:hypothetical protein
VCYARSHPAGSSRRRGDWPITIEAQRSHTNVGQIGYRDRSCLRVRRARRRRRLASAYDPQCVQRQRPILRPRRTGTSTGDTVGFAGTPKGPYARGEFYARKPDRSYQLVADIALQNPVSPTDALVTNGGYLVTFDNWHNFGYGTIVAIYTPGGRLVRGFSAEQLYSPERLAKVPVSTSSRWWRCSPHGYVDPDNQTTIYVFEHFGGTFYLQRS